MYIFEVRRLEKYLTNKMLFEFHSSNGKLVRTGQEFWFPDDVTIGYIIGKAIFISILVHQDNATVHKAGNQSVNGSEINVYEFARKPKSVVCLLTLPDYSSLNR